MNKIINSITKIFLCCSFLGFVGTVNQKAPTKKEIASKNFGQINHRMLFSDPENLSPENIEEINSVGSGLKVKGNVVKDEVRWIAVAVKYDGGKRYFNEIASFNADRIDPGIIKHITDKISFIKPRNSYVIYDAPEFGNWRYFICEIIRSGPDRSTLLGKKEKQAEYKEEDKRNIEDLLAEIEGATKKATKNRPSTTATSSGDNPLPIEKAEIINTKAKKEKKATKNRPSTTATSSGDNPLPIEEAEIIKTKAKKE